PRFICKGGLSIMNGTDILLSVGIIFFFACAIGGMIKFYQTIQILRKGPPPVDEDLVITEEDFEDNE
ncbi:MAG: hypothetical protein ABF334_08985, partial [Akkermansiaceae bacterium]